MDIFSFFEDQTAMNRDEEMMMNFDMNDVYENRFFKHYMDFKGIGIFLLVALAGLAVVLSLLLLYGGKCDKTKIEDAGEEDSGLHKKRTHGGKAKKRFVISHTTCWLIESFYELVFSSTSILFFLAAYYLIDRYLEIREYRILWDKYSDVLLMIFIFLSIFFNAWLDHVVVYLRMLDSKQKGALRLVSTIYMLLIFGYIRFIYDDLNYNELIIYFMGLVIGRFIYFDFTWKDFVDTMGGVVKNLPLLLLIVSYSGLMCFVGFKSKFLLKANGVIVSVFIAHIFMDVSIIIFHHLLKHFREDKQRKRKKVRQQSHTKSSNPD